MSGDSPLPEWYEPPDDEPPADEPDPLPDAAEMLVIDHGFGWWIAAA